MAANGRRGDYSDGRSCAGGPPAVIFALVGGALGNRYRIQISSYPESTFAELNVAEEIRRR